MDARGDRSPGEFYQLEMEMAFATHEDVFAVLETVLLPFSPNTVFITRPPQPLSGAFPIMKPWKTTAPISLICASTLL
jgi:aspartyl-tRNA synthetase